MPREHERGERGRQDKQRPAQAQSAEQGGGGKESKPLVKPTIDNRCSDVVDVTFSKTADKRHYLKVKNLVDAPISIVILAKLSPDANMDDVTPEQQASRSQEERIKVNLNARELRPTVKVSWYHNDVTVFRESF